MHLLQNLPQILNLKYIVEFFSQNISAELDKILLIPKLADYTVNAHGVIFEIAGYGRIGFDSILIGSFNVPLNVLPTIIPDEIKS